MYANTHLFRWYWFQICKCQVWYTNLRCIHKYIHINELNKHIVNGHLTDIILFHVLFVSTLFRLTITRVARHPMTFDWQTWCVNYRFLNTLVLLLQYYTFSYYCWWATDVGSAVGNTCLKLVVSPLTLFQCRQFVGCMSESGRKRERVWYHKLWGFWKHFYADIDSIFYFDWVFKH